MVYLVSLDLDGVVLLLCVGRGTAEIGQYEC